KLEGYAARLALLHHCVRAVQGDDPNCTGSVQQDSVEAGITLARWFAEETRRVYAVLSESAEERTLRELIDFIKGRGWRMTTRQLQHSNGGKSPTAGHAEAALEGLVKVQLGRWIEGAAPERGGHSPRALELLPTADPSDTRPPQGREPEAGSVAT